MIDLNIYEEYWEDIATRVPGIRKVYPLTVDANIGTLIQSLGVADLPILFVIVPQALGNSRNADNIQESNLCVVFIMDKYDNQRKKAYQVLKDLQPTIELIKNAMIEDSTHVCHFMSNLELNSISTIPESSFYKDMAGWSVGFKMQT